MRRRLVLVIGQLQQGGAEGQLVHLATGLIGTDWVPAVACMSEVAEPHATTLRGAGIPVAVFPRARHRDWGRARALAAMLGRERADVVHSFLVGANAYAYAGSRLAGISCLVTSSRTSMPVRSALARTAHAWVFRRSSAVIANSEWVRSFTASYYGVPRDRIRVVRNGVDLAAFSAGGGPAARIRAEFGVPEGGLLIGTLGRLSREKNLELFVDVAAALSREFPLVSFAIIGEGPHRAAVEAAVKAAAGPSRVHLAGAHSDVPAVLSALDIFLTTSDTEGLPNAVMEAMACALPVVATRVGGTHEIVEEGVTGRLVPPGRIVPILEAIRPLIADRSLRVRMGQAGRARIEASFSLEAMVSGTLAVYEEALAGGKIR